MKLTGKQQKFCTEYIQCLNATEACRRAGYAGSDSVLAVQGHDNLRNPKILEELNSYFQANIMQAQEVLNRLTEIARGDLDDCLDEKGNIDLAKARARNKTHLIRKLKNKAFVTEEGDYNETTIEAYDKLRALEDLAKHHNLINHIVVDDWRSQALADIKAGKIQYQALADAFDHDLATQLFIEAGLEELIGS